MAQTFCAQKQRLFLLLTQASLNPAAKNKAGGNHLYRAKGMSTRGSRLFQSRPCPFSGKYIFQKGILYILTIFNVL